MYFLLSKSKGLLQRMTSLIRTLILDGMQVKVVELFTYLISCKMMDDSRIVELSTRLSKASTMYSRLNYLERQLENSWKPKCAVYCVTVC